MPQTTVSHPKTGNLWAPSCINLVLYNDIRAGITPCSLKRTHLRLPIVCQNTPCKSAKTPRFVAKGTFSLAHFRNFVAKVYPSQPVILRKVTFSQIAFRKRTDCESAKGRLSEVRKVRRGVFGGPEFRPQTTQNWAQGGILILIHR